MAREEPRKERVAHRSFGGSVPGGVQDQVGWGFEQMKRDTYKCPFLMEGAAESTTGYYLIIVRPELSHLLPANATRGEGGQEEKRENPKAQKAAVKTRNFLALVSQG